jgi:hypothetical protein
MSGNSLSLLFREAKFVSQLRFLRRVPVTWHRSAPGVPAEVKAIVGASGLQPLPRVIAVQNGSHSSQLVLNQSV